MTVIQSVAKVTEISFPKFVRISVGSILILRYICPAILTPESYGLMEIKQDGKNLLKKVSRVLQMIANEKLFANTSIENIYNPLIQELTPRFQKVFDLLLDVDTQYRNLSKSIHLV